MSLPHETIRVQVWADIDAGIAPMVRYLNTFSDLRTHASCQGTIGEGGPAPYRPQVMVTWETPEAKERLCSEFDMTPLGTAYAYFHPREGWVSP